LYYSIHISLLSEVINLIILSITTAASALVKGSFGLNFSDSINNPSSKTRSIESFAQWSL